MVPPLLGLTARHHLPYPVSMLHVVGRPSSYTEALGIEVCRRLIAGLAVWEIALDPEMPCAATVFNWLHDSATADPQLPLHRFLDLYARAKAAGAEAGLDRADRVARDGGRDIIVEEHDGIRVERVDHENIQRSKLICDQIRWDAARRAPHKFGDRLAHQMLDEKGQPARLEITVSRVERKK